MIGPLFERIFCFDAGFGSDAENLTIWQKVAKKACRFFGTRHF